MGVEIRVEGLTKRFGKQTIWEDVTLTLPAGEISVLLGPSGTGKSVFLKTLVGLLRPNAGHIWINGKDLPHLNEHDLYDIRRLFGVLFQDGALFGSMNMYDNIAFPLREHTKKTEAEIRTVVQEKMEMVGLLGSEKKLPGEVSGGMRKRAGLARALVLDPEIMLFDEPDSGLDPVRTAYLNQLIVDLNAQIEATFLIVTHDINTARTVPDNIGLLFRRNLVMFGPRMDLLTSDEPVVRQFLNGRREGPIGMAEEKDAAQLAAEESDGKPPAELPPIEKQLQPTSGVPRRTQRTAHGHAQPVPTAGESVRVLAGPGSEVPPPHAVVAPTSGAVTAPSTTSKRTDKRTSTKTAATKAAGTTSPKKVAAKPATKKAPAAKVPATPRKRSAPTTAKRAAKPAPKRATGRAAKTAGKTAAKSTKRATPSTRKTTSRRAGRGNQP